MGGQLKAIHGLDPISWWPLAPGWWISALLILLSILIIALFIRHLINYPPGSWRKGARGVARTKKRGTVGTTLGPGFPLECTSIGRPSDTKRR